LVVGRCQLAASQPGQHPRVPRAEFRQMHPPRCVH
jgi:hypothetical protein